MNPRCPYCGWTGRCQIPQLPKPDGTKRYLCGIDLHVYGVEYEC